MCEDRSLKQVLLEDLVFSNLQISFVFGRVTFACNLCERMQCAF